MVNGNGNEIAIQKCIRISVLFPLTRSGGSHDPNGRHVSEPCHQSGDHRFSFFTSLDAIIVPFVLTS